MKKFLAAAVIGLSTLAMTTLASAQDMSKMMGKWKWENFVIEVTAGGDHDVSAKVISGPKNVGMEMMQSKMTPLDGGAMGAQVKHPATGDTYNAKLTFKDANTWTMAGCTAANVCASGEFTRVK